MHRFLLQPITYIYYLFSIFLLINGFTADAKHNTKNVVRDFHNVVDISVENFF